MKTYLPILCTVLIIWPYTACSPTMGLQVPTNTGIRTAAKTSKPSLKRLPNGHYRVMQDWTVKVGGRKFVVQQGYTSNGITAPASVKMMLGDNVHARETWCAVFHDWCFTQPNLTRKQCDTYFVQLMRQFRIPQRKIQLMGTAAAGYTLYKKM